VLVNSYIILLYATPAYSLSSWQHLLPVSLHQVQKNSDALMNDIRRNKGIEVSIVRPRGYIIAGLRNQLNKTKMVDDFRILNESLKNIDIILYDDLLNNLETFVSKIGVE